MTEIESALKEKPFKAAFRDRRLRSSIETSLRPAFRVTAGAIQPIVHSDLICSSAFSVRHGVSQGKRTTLAVLECRCIRLRASGLMSSNLNLRSRQKGRLREQGAALKVPNTSTARPIYKHWTKFVFPLLVCFRILNALCVKTFFQPDEYFQSLEPAWRIAFGSRSGAWITWVGLKFNGCINRKHILKLHRNGNTNSAHLYIRQFLLLSMSFLKSLWRA